jgi:hypothetical protein
MKTNFECKHLLLGRLGSQDDKTTTIGAFALPGLGRLFTNPEKPQ